MARPGLHERLSPPARTPRPPSSERGRPPGQEAVPSDTSVPRPTTPHANETGPLNPLGGFVTTLTAPSDGARSPDGKLHRSLGLWQLTLLGVSTQIGSGWLFAVLSSASVAGPAAVLSWIIGAILFVIVSLTWIELGTLFPRSGGIVRYPALSHGAFAGWVTGWGYWIGTVCLPAVEAQAVLTYLGGRYPQLHLVRIDSGTTVLDWPAGILGGVALLLMFFVLNLFGVRLLAKVNTWVTVWKVVVPVATFILLFSAFEGRNFHAHGGFLPTGPGGIVHALAIGGIAFGYLGSRQVLDYGGEARNPRRDIPPRRHRIHPHPHGHLPRAPDRLPGRSRLEGRGPGPGRLGGADQQRLGVLSPVLRAGRRRVRLVRHRVAHRRRRLPRRKRLGHPGQRRPRLLRLRRRRLRPRAPGQGQPVRHPLDLADHRTRRERAVPAALPQLVPARLRRLRRAGAQLSHGQCHPARPAPHRAGPPRHVAAARHPAVGAHRLRRRAVHRLRRRVLRARPAAHHRLRRARRVRRLHLGAQWLGPPWHGVGPVHRVPRGLGRGHRARRLVHARQRGPAAGQLGLPLVHGGHGGDRGAVPRRAEGSQHRGGTPSSGRRCLADRHAPRRPGGLPLRRVRPPRHATAGRAVRPARGRRPRAGQLRVGRAQRLPHRATRPGPRGGPSPTPNRPVPDAVNPHSGG
ncbi:amino acid permease [Streptomyces botrytidirepellens]|uniref:Amino acid permease n=1 Tax=Streptomyces botrytidirepellens TaxID=2486417 RepID=A0A3M8W2H1_9ACTN|nr:amino acid permease [Streptomyces botrytidirepellens]